MELIAAQYKFKLDSSVLKRYDSSISDGTLCLYNAENGLMWYGNKSSLSLINLLNGDNTVEDIKNEFKNSFALQTDDTTLNDIITGILAELMDKKMITKV